MNFVYAQDVVINEVMASNTTTLFDEDGDTPDWIELYNAGANPVNLTGYFLSDDSTAVIKWQFGEAVINPGDYLVVFASDKDTNMVNWHTNFKITASGEKVLLSDASGNVIDQIYVPASLSDVSYGRTTDAASQWIFQTPTPGTANNGSAIMGTADTVSVSMDGGFYPSSISVELSVAEGEIYYTLDGSDPDPADRATYLYSGPIQINETKVLKTISIRTNYLPSPVIFRSYFINENTQLPVVSLVTDPYNLFDNNYGIYTNFTQDWERPAHVEFFDDDKNLGFAENCGIEIYGSQSANWDQKSIAVKFKNDYGVSKIDYPLFPDFDLTTFKAFVLRNAGNDWQYTHIRDAVMQTLVRDLDIDYLEYRPATSFINGQYWGIYNIREKINEHYIANRHGVDPDNIDLLENNMEVIVGDSIAYAQLIDYISTNDMSTDAAYAYLDSVIDLDECILYFASQAYYDNLDWPGTNIKFWRERTPNGKWRWILFGVEFGFGLYAHGPEEDHITFMFSPVETRYSNPPWATLLQRKLIENPTIRNRFINQVSDLLNTNFQSDRVVEVINRLADHISGDIGRHRSRWKLAGESTAKMITFAQQRPGYMRTHVRNYFNSGLDVTINLDATEGGKVTLNTLHFEDGELPFSGKYFLNVPVELTATPLEGYKFDGWSGAVNSTEQSISVQLARTANITANFSVDTDYVREIVINEINYNSADDFDPGDWVELYNNSDHSIDLSDWAFFDSDETHKFVLPQGTVLETGAYLVLVEDDSAFSTNFPNVANFIGETGFGLSGSGEFMKLVNSDGQIVDSLTYDDLEPWPLEADGTGATLELTNPTIDNSVAENWKASAGHGTPGAVNSQSTHVAEENSASLPQLFTLSQNYPNPFNPTTNIRYSLPRDGHATLKVFDLLGREVATLVDGVHQAGEHEIAFNGSDLASGVYVYRLETNGLSEAKKFLLLK